MTEEQKTAILRAIDKRDRIGNEGVRQLLTDGRLDGSGTFTTGAGLSDTAASVIIYFINIQGETNANTLFKMERFFRVMTMAEDELRVLNSVMDAALKAANDRTHVS